MQASSGPHDDLRLSVAQQAELGESKLDSVDQVGEAQKDEETGKTTISYNVKLTTPEGTQRSFKITVGFNEEALKGHFKNEEAAVAATISKIVNNMNANDIIEASGSRISTRLDDLDRATVTSLKTTGAPPQSLAELKATNGKLADSIGRVIKVFSTATGKVTPQANSQTTVGGKAPPLQTNGKVSARASERQEDVSGEFSGVSFDSQVEVLTDTTDLTGGNTPADMDNLLADLDDGLGTGADGVKTGKGSAVSEEQDSLLTGSDDGSGGELSAKKSVGSGEQEGRLQRARSMNDGSGTAAAKKGESRERSRSVDERTPGLSSPPAHLMPKPAEKGSLVSLPKSLHQLQIEDQQRRMAALGPPPELKIPPPIQGSANQSGNEAEMADDEKKTPVGSGLENAKIETGREVSDLREADSQVHSVTTLDMDIVELSPSSLSPKSRRASLEPKQLRGNYAQRLREHNLPNPTFEQDKTRKDYFEFEASFDQNKKIGAHDPEKRAQFTDVKEIQERAADLRSDISSQIKKVNKNDHTISSLYHLARRFDSIDGLKGGITVTSDGTKPESVKAANEKKKELMDKIQSEKDEAVALLENELKPSEAVLKARKALLDPQSKPIQKGGGSVKALRRALAIEITKAMIDPEKYGESAQRMLDNLENQSALKSSIFGSNQSLRMLHQKYKCSMQDQQGAVRGAIEEFQAYGRRIKGLQAEIASQDGGPSEKQKEQLEIYKNQIEFYKEALTPMLEKARSMLKFNQRTLEHSQLETYVADLEHIISSDDPEQAAMDWKDRNRTVQDLLSGMQTSYQVGMGGDSGVPYLNDLEPEPIYKGHQTLKNRDKKNAQQYDDLDSMIKNLVQTAYSNKMQLKAAHDAHENKRELSENAAAAVANMKKAAEKVLLRCESLKFEDSGSQSAGEMSKGQLMVKANQFLRFLNEIGTQ